MLHFPLDKLIMEFLLQYVSMNAKMIDPFYGYICL